MIASARYHLIFFIKIICISGISLLQEPLSGQYYIIEPDSLAGIIVNDDTCPVITSLSVPATDPCMSDSFTLTANGLTDMSATLNGAVNYGISFKSFTENPVDPYVGGSLLGSVAFNELSSGGTSAVLNTTTINSSGSYFIYAILNPAPGDASCRPAASGMLMIQDLDDASFNYGQTEYCQDGMDPIPTITGLSGGVFSSDPAGLSLNTSDGTLDLSSSLPDDYIITYTTAGVCPNSMQQMVTINASPGCLLSGMDAVCSGSTNNSYIGPPGMSNYEWMISGNGMIDGMADMQDVSVTALGAGSFTLTLTITDSNGCQSSCMKLVTVNSLPVCTISGVAAMCAGSAGELFSGPPGMSSYEWMISGNGMIDGMTDMQDVSMTALGAGSFTLTLTITDSNGCQSSCMKLVTVNALPVCSITGSEIVCAGSTANLYLGPTGMVNYSWTISGDGVITGPANEEEVEVLAGSTGNFQLDLVIMDSNNCSNSCSIVVFISEGPDNPTIIRGPSIICPPLNRVEYMISPVDRAITYNWSINDPNVTVSSAGTTAYLEFNDFFSGALLSVNAINECGVSSPVDLPIEVGLDKFCALVACSKKDLYIDNLLHSLPGFPHVIWTHRSIVSDAQIEGTEDLVFKAGQHILFFPAFSVAKNATLIAQIESCYNTILIED